MSKQEYKVFPNRLELLKFFGKHIPALDVSVSVRIPPFMLSYEGKLIAERNLSLYYKKLAELSGLDVDIKASTQRGGTYIVFFTKQPSVEKTIPDLPLTTDILDETKPEVTAQELVEEETTAKDINLVMEEAGKLFNLEDKKGSKDQLAAFATQYDITLSKAKTFENMLNDLESALKTEE